MIGNTFEAFSGWSVGYSYATAKNKEEEIKQGKNYYLSSFALAGEIALLCTVVDRVATAVLTGFALTSSKVLTTVVPLLSLPACLLAAVIKHGNYANFANWYNTFNLEEYKGNFDESTIGSPIYSMLRGIGYVMPEKLPDALSETASQIYSLMAEYLGDLVRIAMLAGAVALVVLEQYYFAGAMLAALGFQTADSLGLLPYQVSLFAETYLPVIATAGAMLTSGWITFLMMIPQLVTELMPHFGQQGFQKLDSLYRAYAGIKGPNLAEFDAPVEKPTDLSFEEIMGILKYGDMSYEINPAHCSKSTYDQLPTDGDFDKFVKLFELTDWTKEHKLIAGKLFDDERFIDYLGDQLVQLSEAEKAEFNSQKYPLLDVGNRKNILIKERPPELAKKIDHIERFPISTSEEAKVKIHQEATAFDVQRKEAYNALLELLAKKKEVSVEQFLADQLKENMQITLQILKLERPVKGKKQDLEDAIANCSRILPYLNSLGSELAAVQERENALLKLFVEGGDYCARGLKRASSELLSSIQLVQVTKKEDEQLEFDSITDYEFKLEQKLQDIRYWIVQQVYLKIREKLPKEIMDDVHTLDIYRQALSLGFYPLTGFERRDVTLEHFILWEGWSDLRNIMLGYYQARLNEAPETIGMIHFTDYIRKMINANGKLSDEEKQTLEAIFAFTDGMEEYLHEYSDSQKQQLQAILDTFSDGIWSGKIMEDRFITLALVKIGILRKRG